MIAVAFYLGVVFGIAIAGFCRAARDADESAALTRSRLRVLPRGDGRAPLRRFGTDRRSHAPSSLSEAEQENARHREGERR